MGNASLASDEGLNTDRIHARYLRDMSRIWRRYLGSRDPARLALLRRTYRTFVAPDVLRATAPDGRSLARRTVLLRSYLPIFWRLPEFWLRTVPALAFAGQELAGRRAPASRATLPLEQRLARLRASGVPSRVPTSHEFTVRLDVENAAPVPLDPDPPRRVVIGYRWYGPEREVSLQGPALPLPKRLGLARKIACGVRILSPSEPGPYELQLALAQEGVGWFDDRDPQFACRVSVEVCRYGWSDRPTGTANPTQDRGGS
jgi:hypothetical protein